MIAENLFIHVISAVLILSLGFYAGSSVYKAIFPPDDRMEHLVNRIDLFSCGQAHALGRISASDEEDNCIRDQPAAGYVPIAGDNDETLIAFNSGESIIQVTTTTICPGREGSTELDYSESVHTYSNPLETAAVCIFTDDSGEEISEVEIPKGRCEALKRSDMEIVTLSGVSWQGMRIQTGCTSLTEAELITDPKYPDSFGDLSYTYAYIPFSHVPIPADEDVRSQARPLYVEYYPNNALFLSFALPPGEGNDDYFDNRREQLFQVS